MQNQILIMQALAIVIHQVCPDDMHRRMVMADMTTRISKTMECLRIREEVSSG